MRIVNAGDPREPLGLDSIGTPSTGEVSAPGLPGAAEPEWSCDGAASPTAPPGEGDDDQRGEGDRARPGEGHAGARPVPLLPGLTAGSPAAHRGQSTPASYVGRSSAHSARSG